MKKRSRTTYSLMNIGTGMVGYFLNTVIGFVCRMVFVRCLATEYLGINGLFSNVLSMLSLAELGIGAAIVYALYKPLAENDEEKIASLMQFYCKAYRIIGIVVAAAGLLLLPFLHVIIGETPQIKENIYVIYLLYLFNTTLTYFFSYRASLLTAAQRNYVQLGISYIASILQSILQIVVLLLFKEYMLYLVIQTLGIFAYNIAVSKKAVHDYPYIKNSRKAIPLPKEEKRSLFKNVKALTVSKVSELLIHSTDNIIITYLHGLVVVGEASNYMLFSSIITSLTGQVFGSLVASVGNLNAIESDEKKYDFFKKLLFSSFVIYSWVALGLWFVSSDMVQLLYGEKYVLAESIPFVIAFNFFVINMVNPAYTYRSTLGLFKYGQYLTLVTAAINIGLSIWLGKLWGLFGVYIATAIARLLTNVWYIPLKIFKYGLRRKASDYFVPFLKYWLVFAAEAGVCYLLCGMLHLPVAWNVVSKIAICTIVPLGATALVFGRNDDFRYLLGKAKGAAEKIRTRLHRQKAE